MSAVGRVLGLLGSALAGLAFAYWFGIVNVDHSAPYQTFVTAVLGFGLYASTRSISINEFRHEIRTVLIAVTMGVFSKAAIIGCIMYLAFRKPEYIILGIAVAQIDPVSVSALNAKAKMSRGARTLLLAWASFDDPMTVLLTIYASALVMHAGAVVIDGTAGSFVVHILLNLALVAAMWLIWRGILAIREKYRATRKHRQSSWVLAAGHITVGLVLIAVAYFAVTESLLLGLALIGLFFRPQVGRFMDVTSQIALYTACFAVGIALVHGVQLGEGLVLGGAAYLSQVIVSFVVTIPKRWRGDRVRLALGQQNGLTAIVLALLLEPTFPGAIAVIAPAVLVVYVLHAVCNGLWDRFRPPAVDYQAMEAARPDPAKQEPVKLPFIARQKEAS